LQGFSTEETIAHFKVIVTNHLDLRRIEFLVLEIIEISQKCSDPIKTSISIDCCLEIMKRSLNNDTDKNSINEQDCLLIIKNMFKENQLGQYTIIGESLRPMTDFILSSLQKAKES
jgi:proteasome assembly chaperone (PAC2) family protein